jgi:hypothetical protein
MQIGRHQFALGYSLLAVYKNGLRQACAGILLG